MDDAAHLDALLALIDARPARFAVRLDSGRLVVDQDGRGMTQQHAHATQQIFGGVVIELTDD